MARKVKNLDEIRKLIIDLMPLLVIVVPAFFKLDNVFKKLSRIEVQIDKADKYNSVNKHANLQLLSVQLKSCCKSHIKKGFITDEDLEDLTRLHEAYKALGGNGNRDRDYKKCCELEIKYT